MERRCWVKPYRNLTHCFLGAYTLATADQQYSNLSYKKPFQNEWDWAGKPFGHRMGWPLVTEKGEGHLPHLAPFT